MSNGESFDAVVLPHLDAAHRLARWSMRDEHDAEDLVQEASLRAFKILPHVHRREWQGVFLRIVRNSWLWLARQRLLSLQPTRSMRSSTAVRCRQPDPSAAAPHR